MRHIYILLLIVGLWVIVGCQNDATGDLLLTATAVPTSQFVVETTIAALGEITAIPPTPESVITLPLATTTSADLLTSQPTPVATHIVQRGDTLYRISRKYSIPIEDLIAFNNLFNPNRIYVGQHILLGSSANPATEYAVATPVSSPMPSPPPATTHIVQRGDTLYRISRKYNIPVGNLIAFNNLFNPNRIYVGQHILLGSSANQATEYIVKRGDTLFKIARSLDANVSDLASLNHLVNPNQIFVGQRLLLPSNIGVTLPNIGVTLRLNFETDGAMAVHSFGITEYEFVDSVLDDWISETTENGQPWMALGRVLTTPYNANNQVAPMWVVIKPDDMPDSVLFWEESAKGELLEELSIDETITLNDPVDFDTFLQARDKYYLPEVNGILSIERLLVKTGETTGGLYRFVPDSYSMDVAHLPYTFVCDNAALHCMWTYQSEVGSSDSKEFAIIYEAQNFDWEARVRAVTYFVTGNGRSLECDIEEAVCFDAKPYHFNCDNETCTYEHYYEAEKRQVFTLISYQSYDSDWNVEGELETFQNKWKCNWDRAECYENSGFYVDADSAGGFESKRCGLLYCSSGYFCTWARYRNYSCHLYGTSVPQR